MKTLLLFVTSLMAFGLSVLAPAHADEYRTIRDRLGGANLLTTATGEESSGLYQALAALGLRNARMNSYGWRDYNDGMKPTPDDFDAAVLEAYNNGVTPILLFEYYGNYQKLNPPLPVGDYDNWFAVGKAYAERFGPGGTWAREHNAGDWGVKIFTAFNEPDVKVLIDQKAYHDALAGLADGAHAVNPDLQIVPGGFATCNSHHDPLLRGYGKAIADLLNDGRLAGIDLHTYYHDRWYPMQKGRDFSAQRCFDNVKAAIGVTRDINFYSTEFNVARDGEWTDDKVLNSLFLTGLWDHLGMQKADGSPAAVIAFPWNLFVVDEEGGPIYRMAATQNPWTPAGRANVLKTVVDLAGDMRFVSLDAKASGVFVLEDEKSRLVVFQNRVGWADNPTNSWTVNAPEWAAKAELWGWDGLRETRDARGEASMTFAVPGNETYMLRLSR